MSTLSIILQSILGLGFLMFGFMKFSKPMEKEFERCRLPRWFRHFTGLVELAAAVLLIAGIWQVGLAALGGLAAAVTMLGAIATHLRIKDPAAKITMPAVLLVLGLAVLLLNAATLSI